MEIEGQHVPYDGDVQLGKRELIRLGMARGRLTRSDLADHLPLAHMTEVELETLTFSLETLGIELDLDS